MKTGRSGSIMPMAESEQVSGKVEFFFYYSQDNKQSKAEGSVSDAGIGLSQGDGVPYQATATGIDNMAPFSFMWSRALEYRICGTQVLATTDRISLVSAGPMGPINHN